MKKKKKDCASTKFTKKHRLSAELLSGILLAKCHNQETLHVINLPLKMLRHFIIRKKMSSSLIRNIRPHQADICKEGEVLG